jgi:iron complex outermembrane receptor protein
MNVRLVLASGAALSAIALSAPAMAQDVTTSCDPVAEEDNAIIVTARRQSESLEDVPASVTVFGAETLAKTGVQRADDFIS